MVFKCYYLQKSTFTSGLIIHNGRFCGLLCDCYFTAKGCRVDVRDKHKKGEPIVSPFSHNVVIHLFLTGITTL